MTRAALVALAAMLWTPAWAVDGLVPVQGQLLDDAGDAVDATVDVTFSLYDSAGGGTPLWTETQSVAFADGVFTAYLGDSQALQLEIFRDNPTVFLGIAVDGGAEMDLVEIGSVPYAGYAEFAGDAATLAGAPSADLEYTAGYGLNLASNEFSVNQAEVEALATGVCFDNESELIPLLSDDFRPVTWSPTWGDIVGIPDDISDGDDGFTLEAELTALLDDNYLASTWVPDWDDITGIPTELQNGLTAASPLELDDSAGILSLTDACGVDQLLAWDGIDWLCAPIADLILAVDGPGSGLNADLLDGQEATAFAPVSHEHATSDLTSGTLSTDRYSAYSDLGVEGYLDGAAASDLLTRSVADGLYLNTSENHSAALITSGTLSTDRYDAYDDLATDGYLDNNAGTDLLTQSQADGRFLNTLEGHSAALLTTGTLSTGVYDAYDELDDAGHLSGGQGTDLPTITVADARYLNTTEGHSAALITSGTLGVAYYDSYSDLSGAGHLSNNNTTDLLTQGQGDGRYMRVQASGARVTDGTCALVPLTFCPTGLNDGPTCSANTPMGAICEADSTACGGNGSLDNCPGAYDFYMRVP